MDNLNYEHYPVTLHSNVYMQLYYMIKCISGNNSSDTKNNDIQNTQDKIKLINLLTRSFAFSGVT